ncbi:MAG TPA: MlaD family protein [Terriglobia bacterium]|nr:MlaD family protein [Terriglobia bacterium]
MPQRKELTWGQLRVGLMVGISLLILIVGIFFISGQVNLLGGYYVLKAYFPEAQGLRSGAQVQLAGVPVGNVSRISLSSSQDPDKAVVVLMKVSRRYEKDIRGDSVATIDTAGLLGEGYVNITRGSAGQPVLPAKAVVQSEQRADIKKVVQNANDVLSNLTSLSAKLNSVTGQITNGRGTVGKFIYDPALYNRLDDTVAKLQTVATEMSQGNGTLGKLLTNDELYNKLNSTADRANQMMDELQHGQGTIAKLISDPSVYNNLNKTITQTQRLVNSVNQGSGTLGKLVKDPQLYNRLDEAAKNVSTITGRMANGEGSLGLLSTDNRLYNSLAQSSQSLRQFLTEFQKNPKKFLTLRLHIF